MIANTLAKWLVLASPLCVAPCGLTEEVKAGEVTFVDSGDGAIEVRHGGELFTRYVYADTPKPILYPIVGPHDIPMTRNYPMKKGVKGEATDHVHHRSLWFAHGDVNGVDFWLEGPRMGKIVHDRFGPLESGTPGRLTTYSNWVAPGGKVICRESRVMLFDVANNRRTIELRITLHASEGPITFGDTKEGTMAMRTHPKLRLTADPARGGLQRVFGQSVNSEGVRNVEVWGKRARWVDYSADINERTVGIAFFDHPTNPRHPTWWMARDYGLVAANPFGSHELAGRPAGEGRLEVAEGDKIGFRYLYLFHSGNAEEANIARLYDEWSEEDSEEGP